MSDQISRRSAVKWMGLGSGALAFPFDDFIRDSERIAMEPDPRHVSINKPITAITLGAGSRGNTYGNYAIDNASELKIIGVAEPIFLRNERYAKKHNISDANRFTTWEHVLQKPKMADAVIITMPDNLHYEPCMQALAKGYDVLLEKPMAQTEQQCRNILRQVRKTGRIVAICHVLRYAPYFRKLRSMIQSGAVGELISLQHFEPIEHIHMSHSFVRGNWHNSKETTPIILAKSCHDLDIMRWLIDKPSKSIAAYGGLKWFNSDNAPQGSTARCTDGCAAEATCPYSALKIYIPNRNWTYVFDLPEDKSKQEEAIMNYLRTTNYGRCVYRMDNDQADHYVSSILFEDGVTANFSMEAFTSYHGRRTRVMGSMGDIVGDMKKFTYTDFRTGVAKDWDVNSDDDPIYKNHGHGGGDYGLMKDWVQAVAQHDASLLSSTIDASIDSHVMAFAAERSRLGKKMIDIKL